MTIYILGSDSYIAKRFYEKTRSKENCKRVSRKFPERDYSFDLSNPLGFDFNIIKKNDVILFFAAISSPDYCEKNYQSSYGVNVTGTSSFIEKFLEKDAKILFFSSDGVFRGGEEIFYENSIRKPISKYGEMKLAIEKKFEKEDNVKIFRLSYVYSRQDKFSSYLEDCVKKKCIVEIYPMKRNAVYIDDLIEGVDNLIENWEYWKNPVFNICGEELLSREDTAKLFSELVSPIEIKAVEPGEEFFKGRPRTIEMKSDFFPALLGRKPITIRDAILKEYKDFP